MDFLKKLEKMVDKFYAFMPRRKPDTQAVAQTKIIAHRGAHENSRNRIENTISAFDHAVQLGCWGIEFDVQCSADGALIVHHDLDFKRLFQRNERIDQIKWSKFEKKLPNVPLLEQVVTKYGKKQVLFIEIKESFNQYKQLASILSHLQPVKHYYIFSLQELLLKPLKSIPREAQLLIPVHNNVKKYCQLAIEKSYGGVIGHYLLLTNRHIQNLLAANKVYGVGFVGSKFSLYREMSRRIPWLFTDNAAAVMEWFEELKVENPD